MMGEARHIDWTNLRESVPGFLTAVMMPFTFSIPNGILFGMGSSFVLYIASGDIFTDIDCYFNPQLSKNNSIVPVDVDVPKGKDSKTGGSDTDALMPSGRKNM